MIVYENNDFIIVTKSAGVNFYSEEEAELDSEFIKRLFKENAPEFRYIERLENLKSFPAHDDERSLKNLIFKKSHLY